jgi:hypothetical protein
MSGQPDCLLTFRATLLDTPPFAWSAYAKAA